MKRIAYADLMDKSSWGEGPWVDELDKLQWLDEDALLPCLILRNDLGNFCGYVGVTMSHPLYGKEYNEPIGQGWIAMARLRRWLAEQNGLWHDPWYDWHEPSPERIFDAHGGLTFSGPSHYRCDDRGLGIITEPGDPVDIWWFGFDCAHAGDLIPGMNKYGINPHEGDIYRDANYVIEQCHDLAKQLKDYKDGC